MAGLGAAVPLNLLLGAGGGILGDGPDLTANGTATGVQSQTNSAGSTATATQNAGDATNDVTNLQAALVGASADNNTTETNQTGGETTVIGSGASGTAGNAFAATNSCPELPTATATTTVTTG